MPSTYTLISSNVLSSSAASVTFSAIPSTYTDLILKASIRDTGDTANTEVLTRFNSDSSALYSGTFLRGNGSAASSARRSGETGSYPIANEPFDYTANTFANSEFYIPNYLSTISKPIGGFSAPENNATAASPLSVAAVLYRNTSAITSITMNSAVSFAAGSSFYLYGISKS
jgi:hypothetical protein